MEINLNKLKGDIDLKNESWFVRISLETGEWAYEVLKKHGFDFKCPSVVGKSFLLGSILTNTFDDGELSEYLLHGDFVPAPSAEIFIIGNNLVWNKPEASNDLLATIDDEIKAAKKKLKKLKIVREYLVERAKS